MVVVGKGVAVVLWVSVHGQLVIVRVVAYEVDLLVRILRWIYWVENRKLLTSVAV